MIWLQLTGLLLMKQLQSSWVSMSWRWMIWLRTDFELLSAKVIHRKWFLQKNSGEQDIWMSSNRWHWTDFYRKMPLYLLTTKFPIKRASVIVYFLTRITPRPRVDVVVDVATNDSVRNLVLIAADTWFSYRNSSMYFFQVLSRSWTR